MEPDPPDEEFLSAVSPASKDSAIYLQKILKSKEYDVDNIFNQFFITVKHLSQTSTFDLASFLLNLLQHLKTICPPIISKKLVLAVEFLLTDSPKLVNLQPLTEIFRVNWKNIEVEILDVVFRTFKFEVPKQELYEYAAELWRITHWKKSVFLASKFVFAVIFRKEPFEDQFGVLEFLIKRDEVDSIFTFISKSPSLSSKAVQKMCTNKHCKIAGKIVEKANLNPMDFPDLIERLFKASIRYFLHVDDMAIYQLIDLIKDTPKILAIVAEDLEFQGKKNRGSWQGAVAAAIAQQYPKCPIRFNIREVLERTAPRAIVAQGSNFSPLQPEFDICFPLPRDCVRFINTVELLGGIFFNGPIVGIDCEWRPSIVKFQKFKVSLIQIACEDFVYIIDLLALNSFPELDEKLSALMMSEVYKVGVSFDGDRKMLNSSYPHLKAFEKPMKNYIDLVLAYGKVFGNSPGGLAGTCELVLGKGLCKYEQRSNWENRPLTESQMHYAALDSYVEIIVLKELVQSSGLDLKEFVGGGKGYPSRGVSCEFCGSKVHNKNECSRGRRCKICFMTGHKVTGCPR